MAAVIEELVDWLGQILDEQAKKAVPNCVIISGGSPGPSVPNCIGRDGTGGCGWRLEGVVVRPGERPDSWDRAIHEHNLRHLTDDERFTLALVASDRRILALLESSYDDPTYLHVVTLMGSAYADRPGYRDEWWPAGVARETEDAPVMLALLTMVEFLRDRVESDRGQAQYTLNMMSAADAPVMLGSLRSTILYVCERVIADADLKLAIIGSDNQYDGYDQWAATVNRMGADYAHHADYQRVRRA